MTRFWVAAFSATVLPLSFYAVGNQSYYLNLFVETDLAFTLVRILTVIALLAYAFVPAIRNVFFRELVGGVGVLFLGLALVSMISPTLLGYLNDYSAIGETFIFFEAGVLARLLHYELPLAIPAEAPIFAGTTLEPTKNKLLPARSTLTKQT